VINLKSEIKFWMQVRFFLSDYLLHCRLSRSDACGWFDSEKVSDIWQRVLRVIKLNEDFGRSFRWILRALEIDDRNQCGCCFDNSLSSSQR
jgi:hypothetical protein